jgi:hypothetical protein
VLRDGRIVAEFTRAEADAEAIMAFAAGAEAEGAAA